MHNLESAKEELLLRRGSRSLGGEGRAGAVICGTFSVSFAICIWISKPSRDELANPNEEVSPKARNIRNTNVQTGPLTIYLNLDTRYLWQKSEEIHYMPDIRERVEDESGILKKIQNFVPGFRGYRRREDLRDADRMLRAQLAQSLGRQRRGLEDCRKLLAQDYGSKELDMTGGLISQFKKVEGVVTHAETGYSGLVADINIREDELNSLYEYDASMIDHITAMASDIESVKGALAARDNSASTKGLMDIRERITDFEDQFNRRMHVIEGTEV